MSFLPPLLFPTSSSHGFKDVNKTHASFALAGSDEKEEGMIFPDFCFSFPFYVFFSSFRLFLLGKKHISRKENSDGLAIECVPRLLLLGCEDVTILFLFPANKNLRQSPEKREGGKMIRSLSKRTRGFLCQHTAST